MNSEWVWPISLVSTLLLVAVLADRLLTSTIILLFIVQHTSASLTINENYDKDVRHDMEMIMNRIAPEYAPYRHTDEGPDDMVIIYLLTFTVHSISS
jgi:thiamine phosphate synthase YjbQ (UPF0047 family)